MLNPVLSPNCAKDSPIAIAVKAINFSTDELNEAINTLSIRLHPLVPESEPIANASFTADYPGDSPLLRELADHELRLRYLSARIATLINRIEV